MKAEEKKLLTVKEFAKEAGVSLNLIYYYVRLGLLTKPRRSISGAHGGILSVYDKQLLKRMKEIRELRETGKSLLEIKKILKPSNEVQQNAVIDCLRDLISRAMRGDYKDETFQEQIQITSEIAKSETGHPGIKTDYDSILKNVKK
jgi:DNA-binding transcriptional MerR regulator